MEVVVLDTNLIVEVARSSVDLFSELDRVCDFNYNVFVLDKTIDELKGIREDQSGGDSSAADLALQLIDELDIEILEAESDDFVDDILVDLSKEGNVVATQDKELKKRLSSPYIILRNKSHFEMK